MWIPIARLDHYLPDRLPVIVNCTTEGTILTASEPYLCEFKNFTSSTLAFENCTFHCESGTSQLDLKRNDGNDWCKYTENCDPEEEQDTSPKFSSRNDTTNTDLSHNYAFLPVITSNISSEVHVTSIFIDISSFCPSNSAVRILPACYRVLVRYW